MSLYMEIKMKLFVFSLLLVSFYLIIFTPENKRYNSSENMKKRNILATTQNPSMFNRWLDIL